MRLFSSCRLTLVPTTLFALLQPATLRFAAAANMATSSNSNTKSNSNSNSAGGGRGAASQLLTPTRMLEAHQLKSLAASPNGAHALVGVDRWSFSKDEKRQALYLVDVPSETSAEGDADLDASLRSHGPALISSRTNAGVWLSDDEFLFIDDASNTLYVKHIADAVQGAGYAAHEEVLSSAIKAAKHPGNFVGIFPTKVGDMRVSVGKERGSDSTQKQDKATLVFSAEVYADGDITRVSEHDKSDEVKTWDNVKAYDTTFIRHWDQWLYPGKRWQLFAVDLVRHGGKAKWSMTSHFRNLMNGTKLESPVRPFGDASDFAVSGSDVMFTSKDPSVNPAWHTRQNIYLVLLSGSQAPQQLTSGKQGATSSPRFSPSGQHVVWLQMEVDGFEADRNRIVMQHLPTGTTKTILPDWHLSPGSIDFSVDGKSLVGTVEHGGRKRAFIVQLHRPGSADTEELTTLDEHDVVFATSTGSASSLHALPSGSLLAIQSSYKAPGEVVLVSRGSDAQSEGKVEPLTHFTSAPKSSLLGVDVGPDPEHFTYKGSNGRDAHGWLLKPPGYSDDRTYPLLVLVHGGPESAWTDSWGIRWNALTFVAQGYVAIALNPAGSTGYGQAYQEEILGQLGGAPFEDVVLGTRHILESMKSLDPSRTVAAGASYGGYMMNWINGHNDDGLFKGLVCHDGIYSTVGMVAATEELYFPFHEMGGPLWGPARAKYEEWSPERFADKWNTPTLVIHGGQDFRLTESEGISVFNTLQHRGVPSRFLYFPKESHWVTNPRNSLRWHEEVFAWLQKYSAGSGSAPDGASNDSGRSPAVAPKEQGLVFQAVQ